MSLYTEYDAYAICVIIERRIIPIEETEEELEVENWMTNEINFAVLSSFTVEETEEALEVEDWMTNCQNWEVEERFPVYLAVSETEDELNVEGWMVCSLVWK